MGARFYLASTPFNGAIAGYLTADGEAAELLFICPDSGSFELTAIRAVR